jgi:hypothetical protein
VLLATEHPALVLTTEVEESVQAPEFRTIEDGNFITILELVGIEWPGVNVTVYLVGY